jgi:hypothetical protein
MKTTILAVIMTALTGCAARQTDAIAALPAPGYVLAREDVEAKPDAVPEREAVQVVRASFPGERAECGPGVTKAWVKSSIRGSFTAPGSDQVMYFVRSYECDGLPSQHRDELVVYQGGREVWRTAGNEPVRAIDEDGDGQDEWVEVVGKCDPECGAEAWARGYENGAAVELAHLGP